MPQPTRPHDAQHSITRRLASGGRALTLIAIALLAAAPCAAGDEDDRKVPTAIATAFQPPPELANDLGTYKSPLVFDDGRPVRTAADWRERRKEILKVWHAEMGTWPPLIAPPRVEELSATRRESFTERKLRIEVAPDRTVEGYLLVPEGMGPFPA